MTLKVSPRTPLARTRRAIDAAHFRDVNSLWRLLS